MQSEHRQTKVNGVPIVLRLVPMWRELLNADYERERERERGREGERERWYVQEL